MLRKIFRLAIAIYLGIFISSFITLPKSPKNILDTVVMVERSSGIIVYSDYDYSLILTDYHVISDVVDQDGNLKLDRKPRVTFKYIFQSEENFRSLDLFYESEETMINPKFDIALLKIKPGIKFNYSKITSDADVGDEIYIAANPNNRNYRSITKGIISNKNRHRNNFSMWQMDGGVIYGSSGGGAFTTSGKLVALAQAVDTVNMCSYTYNEEGQIVSVSCFNTAIPYVGYFIPPKTIIKFLLSTKFKNNFSYLK